MYQKYMAAYKSSYIRFRFKSQDPGLAEAKDIDILKISLRIAGRFRTKLLLVHSSKKVSQEAWS
jgi:hypothetical protein